MKEIILKPNCMGCEKPIEQPSDCNMELFRLGLYAHNDCIKVYQNIDKVVKDLTGGQFHG